MRELPQDRAESYAGSLLVAHPSMLDPNFRRAVLLISAHTADEGALGVILNRPLEKQVSEVVTETPLNALEKVPVFFGGPVGRDRLIFASLEWKTGEGLKLNHKTGPRHTETRPVAQALVRHHAPAGSVVQAAGRSAGRSIFKLNYGA